MTTVRYLPGFASFLLCCLFPFTAAAEEPSAVPLLQERLETNPSSAVDGKVVSTRVASSVVKDDRIDNLSVRFLTQSLYYRKQYMPVIIKQSLFVRTVEGQEGQLSAMRVELFDPKSSESSVLHTVDVDGDEARFDTHFWNVIKHGCCGADPYGRLYTYEAKQPFLEYHNDYVAVEIPNSSLWRYFGFLWNEGRASKALFAGQPGAIGALFYARPEGTADRVYIFREGTQQHTEDLWVSPVRFIREHWRDNLETDGHKITMWTLDKVKEASQINGPKFEISFELTGADTSETLTARIENDHITGLKFPSKELRAKVVQSR